MCFALLCVVVFFCCVVGVVVLPLSRYGLDVVLYVISSVVCVLCIVLMWGVCAYSVDGVVFVVFNVLESVLFDVR